MKFILFWGDSLHFLSQCWLIKTYASSDDDADANIVTNVKLTCLCCDIHVNTDIYIFLLTKISSCLLQYSFVVDKKIKLLVSNIFVNKNIKLPVTNIFVVDKKIKLPVANSFADENIKLHVVNIFIDKKIKLHVTNIFVDKDIKLPVAMTLPDEHLHATKKQTETAEILKNLFYLIEQLMKLLGVH